MASRFVILLSLLAMIFFWKYPDLRTKIEQHRGSPSSTFFPHELSASEIIRLTNEYRISLGLSPLLENYQLNRAAEYRASDMIINGYFAHNNPRTGEGPKDAILYQHYDYMMYAENIAMGNWQSSRHIVDGWINSPGHRQNIEQPNAKEIGVAVIQDKNTPFGQPPVYYGVQLFASPKPNCQEPNHADFIMLQKMRSKNDSLWKNVQVYAEDLKILKENIGREHNRNAKNFLIDKHNQLIPVFNNLLSEAKSVQANLRLLEYTYNQDVHRYNTCLKNDAFAGSW